MVFYLASTVYREVIHRAATELELVCAGNVCSNEIYLLKYIRENLNRFSNLDELIVDLNALQDTDGEIIQAFEMLRIMNYKTRITILAAGRQPGDELLKNCFAMGLYNLILANVFAEIYEELKYCLTTGKQYKDALMYKEAGTEAGKVIVKKEIKRTVNKIMVGISGTQKRIGCTHLGIVLANHLRKKGYMVALVEYGQRGIYEKIRDAYDEVPTAEGFFSLNGVDYYADIEEQNLLQLLSDKFYNFIIVDFGEYPDCDRLMYSRCDIRILISGAKPWETEYAGAVFASSNPEALKQLRFVFNFVSREQQSEIRKEMAELQHIYFLPVADDPFASAEIGDMEKIFDFYAEGSRPEEKKKRSVFGMLGRKQGGKAWE